jgi:N-acetylmuramoyl-L-alanine amidase
VQVPVPVAVPTLATANSFILQPPEAGTAAISKERLLDYSFVLNNDQVRLSSIFGLDVQIIVIDPGHGGMDPGAIGAMGTKEKDVVLDIARRLRERLMASGRYNVILTREGDSSMTLAERVDKVNAIHADLFISLHVNALPQKRANVIETFYYGPPTDDETLRIAEQENRGSGITASDFDTMIKKIGNTFKEQESATLASSIQHSLFTNAKKYDKDMADAGIKIAPFVVLLGVDAPSVLVEISCISKKQEELKLNLPAYREEITSFLAEGTSRYLARKNLHIVQGEENDEKVRRKNS